MKRLLPISLLTNLLLAGGVGYLIGTRTPAPFAALPFPSRAADATPERGFPEAGATRSSAPTVALAFPSGDVLPSDQTAPGEAQSASRLPQTPVRPPEPAPVGAGALVALGGGGLSPVITENRELAAIPQADANDAPPREFVQAHNPAGLGNTLAFHGVRVGLTETYDSLEGADRGLGVELAADRDGSKEDGPQESVDTVAVAPRLEGAPGGAPPPVPSKRGGRSAGAISRDDHSLADVGLSYEDELFRMKWGWAAYDAARAEARREADRLQNGG